MWASKKMSAPPFPKLNGIYLINYPPIQGTETKHFANYQIFVTKQEIGEKKRIKEIGLRWDINPCVSQMYF